MQNKISVEEAYFNLSLEVAKFCFAPIPKKENSDTVLRIRRNFAKRGKLLQMLCDCTNTLQYSQLKTAILLYNKKNKAGFNKFIKKHHNYNLIKTIELSPAESFKHKYASNTKKSF